MSCWKKDKPKKYKINNVYPENNEELMFDQEEQIKCGGCNEYFSISSNDLKIHCNLCCRFFHCKIAGKCDGNNCKIITDNGEIHRASYCYDCVGLISTNKLLCKDCFNDK